MIRRRLTTFALMNIITILIFILFCAAGLYAAGTGAERSRAELETNVEFKMAYYIDSLNAEIERMDRAVRTLYVNRDVNWVTSNSGIYMDYELASALNRIEEQMNSLNSISDIVKSVKIMLPAVELVFQDSVAGVGNFYKQSASDMQHYADCKTFGMPYEEDGRLMLGYAFTASDKQLMFMVTVELDAKQLDYDLRHVLIGYDAYYSLSFGGEYMLTDLPKSLPNGFDSFMVKTSFDEKLNAEYTVYVPNEAVRTAYKTFIGFACALAALLITCSIGVYLITKRLIHRPMHTLKQGFARMEKGDFNVRLEERGSRDFADIYLAFNQMNEKLYDLIDLTYTQQLLIQKAEFKQLQAQINPHFLYNTLFLLNSLIKSDDREQALSLTRELGEYYRYITRNASAQVTMLEENRHARIYADIQAARFEGRINVEYGEMPDEMALMTVPRLILQPLIENAFTYGLKDKESDGLLKVSFMCAPNYVSVFIEDNGDGLTNETIQKIQSDLLPHDDAGKEVTGSMNIHRRIAMMYASGSGLYYSRSPLGGISAEIRLYTERR